MENAVITALKTRRSIRSYKPQQITDDALVFTYPDREKALAAAKKAVRENHSLSYGRKRLEDGTECFKVTEGMKTLERHCFGK